MSSRWCHLCQKPVDLTNAGVFRRHGFVQGNADAACAMSGESPLQAPPVTMPGLYWVKTPTGWTVSSWDGERWTNIGHDAEWMPDEVDVRDWCGPLKPPA